MRKVSLITAVLVLGLTFALPSSAAHSHAAPTATRPAAHQVTHAAAKVAAAPGPPRRHVPQAISMPTIGVHALIGTSLAHGPIYWDRVGRPGQGTTIAIAGHDVTPVPGFQGHGPFHDIDQLRKGDPVTITWHGTPHAYRVSGQRVFDATNLHIADLTRYERVLLTTCWPRGSSKYRLVVYALPA